METGPRRLSRRDFFRFSALSAAGLLFAAISPRANSGSPETTPRPLTSLPTPNILPKTSADGVASDLELSSVNACVTESDTLKVSAVVKNQGTGSSDDTSAEVYYNNIRLTPDIPVTGLAPNEEIAVSQPYSPGGPVVIFEEDKGQVEVKVIPTDSRDPGQNNIFDWVKRCLGDVIRPFNTYLPMVFGK